MVDFAADFLGIATRELVKWEVPLLFHSSEDILLRYFVLQHRVAEPGPHQVHVSDRAFGWLVSATERSRQGFAAFLRRASSRADLWPHQSRRLLQVGRRSGPKDPQHDGLFNDWAIQHFHLGLGRDADGFVERTGELVFAMLSEGALYVVDVLKHPRDWAPVHLLETLERNWPRLLDRWTARGVAPSGLPLTASGVPATYQDMRNAGLSYMLTLPSGRSLFSPGFGYSTSGHSTLAVMQHDRVMNGLRRLEDYVGENAGALEAELNRERPGHSGLDLHIELSDGSPSLDLVERIRGVALQSEGRPLPALFGI